MNRKQLLLLVVVLAVLAVIGRFAANKNEKVIRESGRGIGEKLIANFPLNDIAKVAIIQSTQQLTLAKSGEIWTVQERGGYPADFTKVSDMLRKFWELKVAKPVRVPETRLIALELKEPDQGAGAGTKVDFLGADGKSLASLLLGAKHMRESSGEDPMGGGGFPDGRYVRVGQDNQNIALVSDALGNLEPRPGDWISKDFFKVEKLKSIALDTGTDDPGWTLQRETDSGPWQLAEPKEEEQLDTTKVSSANYLLSSPYFNDVLVRPVPAEIGLDEPRVALLETFDGFNYKVKLGKPMADDNYPLQVSVDASFPAERTPGAEEKEEDKARLDNEFKEKYDKLKEKLAQEKKFQDWTYTISKWSVDFLLKERKDLLAEKKTEGDEEGTKPAVDPNSILTPQLPLTLPDPAAALPPPPTPPAPAPTAPEPAPAEPKPEEKKPAEDKPAEEKPAEEPPQP